MRAIAQMYLMVVLCGSAARAADPLPSWENGSTKKAILSFVEKVTRKGSPHFVPRSQRIAVFDNDGTLWSEQPLYVQLAFALDRIKALAPSHPEWKNKQPFKAVLERDLKALSASGKKGLMELIKVTHTGMTTDQFEKTVREWISTARHPKYKRPYTECIYQPMLELLAYLRANGIKTWIVSGGGIEFMRPWAKKVYGIPREQIIGSSILTKYEERNGKPVLVRAPQIDFIDDKAGKPVGIHKFIGQRPLMAFGNSDGDYEMLRYVTAGSGARFGMIVHHTDAEREHAYDRDSHIGRLDRALTDAKKYGWVIANMKNDWKTIFPWSK